MAKLSSAQKQTITSQRRAIRNRNVRSGVKTYLTKAEKAIEKADAASAELVKLAISKLDAAVTKGVLHPNNTARHKSRLMKKFNQMEVAKAGQTEQGAK